MKDSDIMNIKTHEENLFLTNVYAKLAEAEAELKAGNVSDARGGLDILREKYNL